jgi:anti-sigma factor RsiW
MQFRGVTLEDHFKGNIAMYVDGIYEAVRLEILERWARAEESRKESADRWERIRKDVAAMNAGVQPWETEAQ